MSGGKKSNNVSVAINKDRGLSPVSSGTPMPTVKPAAKSSSPSSNSSGQSSVKGKKVN